MAYLPEFDDFWSRLLRINWSKSDLIVYLVTCYLDILVYGLLLLLALRNIWMILIKQKEYRNLPILVFYAYALIAVSLRLINIIWYWLASPVVQNLDWIQQASKFCVGVVQDWITLELAIRMHISKGQSDISKSAKRKISCARKLLVAVITVAFAAFSIIVIVSAHKDKNHGEAFFGDICVGYNVIAFAFLSQVVVMICLVIWLFVETQRAVNREMREFGKVQRTLRRERCIYAIITFFFALSYMARFILNEYQFCGQQAGVKFASYMTEEIVWLFEGVSMGMLMIFHFVNFKQGTLLSKTATELPEVLIMPEEFHLFTNEEVDNTESLIRESGGTLIQELDESKGTMHNSSKNAESTQ